MNFVDNFNNSNTHWAFSGDVDEDYSPPGHMILTKGSEGWGAGMMEVDGRTLAAGMNFSMTFTLATNTVGNPGASDDNTCTQIGLQINDPATGDIQPNVWGLYIHGGTIKLCNGDSIVSSFNNPEAGTLYVLTCSIGSDGKASFALHGKNSTGPMGTLPGDLRSGNAKWKVSPYFTDTVHVHHFHFSD